MRDLLPEETRTRRALARAVLDHFALHGYKLVTPPAFELAEVLERGLGALDPSDVLRFIEPTSGEVAALRPDMTPQIARMVATRFGREPRPIRLCYEGTIVRRRQGRARRHRQVAQAGVELYGDVDAGGPQAGDLEILRLAASITDRLDLPGAVIDLGHASIARPILEALPAALAAEVGEALGQKDGARVERLLAGHEGGPTLARLGDLHGGGPGEPSAGTLFAQAAPLLAGTAAEPGLHELRALWTAARAMLDTLPRAPGLRVDLGEVRGFAYYTGAIFHLLAPGPGEPIGAGGRYDDLLARFDAPMPAVGFALYLDAVAWAREAARVHEEPPAGVVVALGPTLGAGEAAPILAALHSLGIAAVTHPGETAAAYAAAWRYTHLVSPAGEPGRLRAEALTPPTTEITADDPGALARAIAASR